MKRQTVLSNSKIVFERHGDINWLPLGLFTFNPDGSNLVQLRSSRTAAFQKWSPDGRWIAFCEVPQGYEFFASNIFIIKPDGEGIRQLTFHKDGAAVLPSWSPDSKSIVYDLYKDQVNQIFIVDIESLCYKQLTYEGSNGEPVFTSSNEIVFRKLDSYPARIFIMDPNGENKREYNFFQVGDEGFEWSRDGEKIVFVRNGRICMINSDGGDFKMVPGISTAIKVSLSPDGEKIAYSDMAGQEIYVVDLNGQNNCKIVANPLGSNEKVVGSIDISWSPWILSS